MFCGLLVTPSCQESAPRPFDVEGRRSMWQISSRFNRPSQVSLSRDKLPSLRLNPRCKGEIFDLCLGAERVLTRREEVVQGLERPFQQALPSIEICEVALEPK